MNEKINKALGVIAFIIFFSAYLITMYLKKDNSSSVLVLLDMSLLLLGVIVSTIAYILKPKEKRWESKRQIFFFGLAWLVVITMFALALYEFVAH